jgi:hypothetical protein
MLKRRQLIESTSTHRHLRHNLYPHQHLNHHLRAAACEDAKNRAAADPTNFGLVCDDAGIAGNNVGLMWCSCGSSGAVLTCCSPAASRCLIFKMRSERH